jgi:flagellar FliL protein
MAKSTPKHGNGGETAAGKPRKKLLVILGALLALLGAGGAGAWYLTNGGATRGGTQHEDAEKPPLFLPLETFTVNLQGDAAEKYLQVGLTLKMDDQSHIDLLKLHMPEVRSRLLTLLSSKKSGDILSPDGKKRLSDEILEQVRQPFTASGSPQGVSAVLFTSFVVQ